MPFANINTNTSAYTYTYTYTGTASSSAGGAGSSAGGGSSSSTRAAVPINATSMTAASAATSTPKIKFRRLNNGAGEFLRLQIGFCHFLLFAACVLEAFVTHLSISRCLYFLHPLHAALRDNILPWCLFTIIITFMCTFADATIIKTAAGEGEDAPEEGEPDPDAVLEGELNRYLLTEDEQKKRYRTLVCGVNFCVLSIVCTMWMLFFCGIAFSH